MPTQTKSSSFFWQGVLIVLPAFLLASLGFYSLRQDRLLAEVEAAEQAKRIANDLVQMLLPEALVPGTLGYEVVENFLSQPARPEDDPILIYARGHYPRFACLISETGSLLYPPERMEFPQPQPLDLAELTEEQQRDWEASNSSRFSSEDLKATRAAYQKFLETEPGEQFKAIAQYRLALLSERANELEASRALLEDLVTKLPHAVAESGFLLRPFAELRLLHLAAQGQNLGMPVSELINSICSYAVVHPSSLSLVLLRKAREKESEILSGNEDDLPWDEPQTSPMPERTISDDWMGLWELHQRARMLHAEYVAALPSPEKLSSDVPYHFWKDLNEESHLIFAQRDESRLWVFGLRERSVRQIVDRVLLSQPIPRYFGLEINVSGRPMTVSHGPLPELASAATPQAAGQLVPGLGVKVFLKDPGSFYARQRTRTLWFGSLIGLSAAAVLVGFVAAHRAFKRQARVSELKTNFVSSVSHELRAPIASVRLMAEELQETEASEKQREYHRFIVQECRRLSALIENVLDFSRHEQGGKEYEFESTDLVALVTETVKLMRPYAGDKEVQIATTISGEAVPAEVDGQSIQQVLVNLMDNAIKHSPPGSVVKVLLGYQKEKVLLTVEDQGQGIPSEDHSKIFERFYRRGSELRRETHGIGLGLAIVKYVTEAHHGKVWVQSEPGKGCRFNVELPLNFSGTCKTHETPDAFIALPAETASYSGCQK